MLPIAIAVLFLRTLAVVSGQNGRLIFNNYVLSIRIGILFISQFLVIRSQQGPKPYTNCRYAAESPGRRHCNQ